MFCNWHINNNILLSMSKVMSRFWPRYNITPSIVWKFWLKCLDSVSLWRYKCLIFWSQQTWEQVIKIIFWFKFLRRLPTSWKRTKSKPFKYSLWWKIYFRLTRRCAELTVWLVRFWGLWDTSQVFTQNLRSHTTFSEDCWVSGQRVSLCYKIIYGFHIRSKGGVGCAKNP